MTEDALKTFRITDGWEIGADAEVFFRKKGGSLGFTNNTLTKPIYAIAVSYTHLTLPTICSV